MRRRNILLGSLGALFAGAAAAQQKNLPLVIWFSRGQADDWREQAFMEGLRELGYEHGRNITLERFYTTDLRAETDALTVVAKSPDVVVAMNSSPTLAMMRATSSIPIVAAIIADPVAQGMAVSFARPGLNVTGTSWIGPEMSAKNLQLLQEAVPSVKRIGIMFNPNNPSANQLMLQSTLEAAKILGLDVREYAVAAVDRVEKVFDEMARDGMQAVSVISDAWAATHKQRLGELALSHKLPFQAPGSAFMAPGILMAYGPSYAALYRRSAHLMDKILKGWKAGDIPFEQPTHFEFVIDMRTAKALGIEFPLGILYRATEIIE